MSPTSGSLAPPENDQYFETLEDCISRINQHAAVQGYAVVFGRTKKSKLGERRKAWLVCDRGKKSNGLIGQRRRHISSKRIECPFSCTVTRENDTGIWVLKVVDPEHNHEATLAGSHSVHRKNAMTEEIESEITRNLKVSVKPTQILFSLRIADPMIATNDETTHFQNQCMFRLRDIYNLKAKIRRESLGPLTPLQALLCELNEEDWSFEYQQDINDHLTRLFFVRKSSEIM